MPRDCDPNEILTLHSSHLNTSMDWLIFLSPFANEFANLLSVTVTKPYFYFEIYPHNVITYIDNIKKVLVDIVALSGIVYLSLTEFKKTNDLLSGFYLGFLYLVFAYAIPNVFMYGLLKHLPQNNMVRLFFGLVFIYLLEVIIGTLHCFYTKPQDKEKNKETD